ncbi:DinB family protein [Mucilaginibacter sp. PAMB04274]|uniref:DinB family protein n=1 Tax=Mucilaginibacter sp. PAMB04274 TaxID=3138568 RepID=UPI0031F64B04
MKTADKLQQELENIFVGRPWYGTPISTIITQGNWIAAYDKLPGSVHSIAHIMLHMIGWTEEVISRLQGNQASEPARGDWPEPGEGSEQKWQQLVIDLDEANSNLIKAMQALPDNKWDELINDQRGLGEPVTTYKGLIYGFIQHQIYHAGQIALLNRMNHVN